MDGWQVVCVATITALLMTDWTWGAVGAAVAACGLWAWAGALRRLFPMVRRWGPMARPLGAALLATVVGRDGPWWQRGLALARTAGRLLPELLALVWVVVAVVPVVVVLMLFRSAVGVVLPAAPSESNQRFVDLLVKHGKACVMEAAGLQEPPVHLMMRRTTVEVDVPVAPPPVARAAVAGSADSATGGARVMAPPGSDTDE